MTWHISYIGIIFLLMLFIPNFLWTKRMPISGEIRPVARLEQRIAEAEKLGFRRMLVPAQGMKGINQKNLKLELVPVRRVAEAVRELFG